MERYEVKSTELHLAFDPEQPGLTAVYLASEVDARISELEKALRDVKQFLEDPRWGTYPYMEGTDVYEDKDEALTTIDSALMETGSHG